MRTAQLIRVTVGPPGRRRGRERRLAPARPARDVQLPEAPRVLLALPGLARGVLRRRRRGALGLGLGCGRFLLRRLGPRGPLGRLVLGQAALLVLAAGPAVAGVVPADLVSCGLGHGSPPRTL